MTLHPLPAFHDNYIWTLSRNGQALVVDPGDATVVEDWLAATGLRLTVVLVTHHHPDHTAGLLRLRDSHAPVIYGPDEGIAGLSHVVRDEESVPLAGFGRAQVLAVPGHTAGHVAYYLPAEGLLFCGDTLFSAGCGRLFEGTAAQMQASLDRLAALPADTLACPTHEYTEANLRFALAVEPDNPALATWRDEVRLRQMQGQPSLPVTLGAEARYNPFLRSREPGVVAAASRHAGRLVTAGQDCFAVLRAWKDDF